MFTLLPTILLLSAVLVIIGIVLRRLPSVTVREEKQRPEFLAKGDAKSRLRTFFTSIASGIGRFFRAIASYAHSAKDYRPKTTYLERMGQVIKLSSVTRFRKLRQRDKGGDGVKTEEPHAGHSVDSAGQPAELRKSVDTDEQNYIDTIARDPGNADAYEALGKIYLERKKYKDAEEVYQFLASHDPGNGNYLSRLGLVHFNLGNYEDAILAYEKAVELEPHKPTRLVNLGFSYEAAGDLIKAITAIESALVIVPENTQYLGILADLLQKNGQFETTAAILEKILQIEPTNQAVRDRLMKLRY